MSFFDTLRKRPAAVFGLILVMTLGGAFMAARLPSSIFPPVTFPIVKVIADAGDEPAARMMPTVTRPLEEAIRRVPGVVLVRSLTSRGSSEMAAQFAWGTDMQVALERVQGETQRIRSDLPPDTRIEVKWMNTSVFPILGYALTSDSLTQAQLWDLAEYTVKPALLGINGVSEVQVQGGRHREFQIRLRQQALEGRGLSAADVADALRANNDIQSAGLIEQQPRALPGARDRARPRHRGALPHLGAGAGVARRQRWPTSVSSPSPTRSPTCAPRPTGSPRFSSTSSSNPRRTP